MASPLPHPCDGTPRQLRLAVGVMSSPSHTEQRVAVRSSWGGESTQILACFIVGAIVKRTPLSPWNPHRPAERALPDGGPKGELYPLVQAADLHAERARFGDVLMLNGSAEIHAGGTSGLKTLTWWRHASAQLPNAEWVGKCDDDTLVNVPRLLARLPPAASASPQALLGSIKWGCYSDARYKWEPSWQARGCGKTQFARSQAAGERANLSLSYEGPYQLALGWLFAMPAGLASLLASCRYAGAFHERAVHATREPFLRKEDDPLNGFWLYKCLREAGRPPVRPLRSFSEGEAHNMACISRKGLYRRPSNKSIAVHFLKTVSAMRYVKAALRWERRGEPRHSQECCSRMVWRTERGSHPPSVCASLLSADEAAAEALLDKQREQRRAKPLGGRGRPRGRRRGRKELSDSAKDTLEV